MHGINDTPKDQDFRTSECPIPSNDSDFTSPVRVCPQGEVAIMLLIEVGAPLTRQPGTGRITWGGESRTIQELHTFICYSVQ
jgi:hypothetical protein